MLCFCCNFMYYNFNCLLNFFLILDPILCLKFTSYQHILKNIYEDLSQDKAKYFLLIKLIFKLPVVHKFLKMVEEHRWAVGLFYSSSYKKINF